MSLKLMQLALKSHNFPFIHLKVWYSQFHILAWNFAKTRFQKVFVDWWLLLRWSSDINIQTRVNVTSSSLLQLAVPLFVFVVCLCFIFFFFDVLVAIPIPIRHRCGKVTSEMVRPEKVELENVDNKKDDLLLKLLGVNVCLKLIWLLEVILLKWWAL